ncbi:MAG: FAD-dependent oxidoreductase [Novosphingobium sp.]|nr:FAD-dependent oxidoreductase [Novosphingobium sp.]
MQVAIVGAGIAGLACADALSSAGLQVRLFDKGRGPGGRMSTRRMHTELGEACFDHGAQYFTARDPEFAAVVERWHGLGIVARWPEAHADAWVGVPGMNAVIRELARPHDVTFAAQVRSLFRGTDGWWLGLATGDVGPFDAVIVAIPAEQAAALLSLHDFEMARIALRARSKPCWTGMFAFAEALETDLDVIRDRAMVAWAARNSAKPGRSGPESWVVQAQPTWSQANCEEDPQTIAPLLLASLGEELDCILPSPIAASAHRWRFAMSNGTGDTALWNPETSLGVCGDWLLGPRVEAGWLSGHRLGHQIAESTVSAQRRRRTA